MSPLDTSSEIRTLKDPTSMFNPANKRINSDVLGHIFGYLVNSDTPRHTLANEVTPIVPYIDDKVLFSKEHPSIFKKILVLANMGRSEIAAREPKIAELDVKVFTKTSIRAAGGGFNLKSNTKGYISANLLLQKDSLLESNYPYLILAKPAGTGPTDTVNIELLTDEGELEYFIDDKGYLFIYIDSSATLYIYDIYNHKPDENLKPINTLVAKKSSKSEKPGHKIFDFPGLKLQSPNRSIVSFAKPLPPLSTSKKIIYVALGLIGVAGAAFAAYSLAPVTFTGIALTLKSAATSSIVKNLATRVGSVVLTAVVILPIIGFILSGNTVAEESARLKNVLSFVPIMTAAAYFSSPATFTASVIALATKFSFAATITGYGVMAAGALTGAGILGQRIWRAL